MSGNSSFLQICVLGFKMRTLKKGKLEKKVFEAIYQSLRKKKAGAWMMMKNGHMKSQIQFSKTHISGEGTQTLKMRLKKKDYLNCSNCLNDKLSDIKLIKWGVNTLIWNLKKNQRRDSKWHKKEHLKV